ncbi:MAG: hypothetical protein IT166_19460 [Bryobacterales bacterium]|nr:hypothetical protein [Bryobacterales bacterium]
MSRTLQERKLMTFQELEASFHRQMQPKGSTEVAVFRQFVNAAWNLRLLSDEERRLAELAAREPAPIDSVKIESELRRTRRQLDLAENAFYRCLSRLTRLMDERPRRLAVRTMTPDRLARLRTPFHVM